MSSQFRRRLNLFDVIERHKPSAVATASTADFDLRHASRLDTLDDSGGSLMYCFDIISERAWFTLCDDMDAVLRAPFLYDAQFRQARQIVTVPFERLDEVASTHNVQPTFIFSIGRCGSTLLAAMLTDIGIPTLSEPDVLTQLADLKTAERAPMAPGFSALLIHTCMASAQSRCGPEFVVKLRSQCNGIATDIVRAFPNASFVFMLRDRISWARSRHRAFGDTPSALAHMFLWGITTYHELSLAGGHPKVIWFEDLLQAPAATLRQIGVAPAGHAETLAVSLARDSQRDTSLSRHRLTRPDLSSSQLEELDMEWRRIRPNDLIAKYSLERVA